MQGLLCEGRRQEEGRNRGGKGVPAGSVAQGGEKSSEPAVILDLNPPPLGSMTPIRTAAAPSDLSLLNVQAAL